MESNNAGEPNRPSILSAAASPTALSNLLASIMLLVSAFLPHAIDLNDPLNRPISFVSWVATSSGENLAFLSVVLWPYDLALWTCIGMLVLVVLRPPWLVTALIVFPIAFATVLSVRWAVFLFSGAESSRTAMLIAAVIAAPGTCVGARMSWLYRSGEVTAAAAWGQSMLCVLAVFSLRWFWFQPISGLYWGGILATVSALLMMFASWTWIGRARYDLLDRSTAPIPFQISLRQIIIAVTLTAIALTYWQAFGAWDVREVPQSPG